MDYYYYYYFFLFFFIFFTDEYLLTPSRGMNETMIDMDFSEALRFTEFPGLDVIYRTYSDPIEHVWHISMKSLTKACV